VTNTTYGNGNNIDPRISFTGLEAAAFQHPLDQQATENLKRLYGFDSIVAKFIELRYERLLYVFNISSSVKVTPRQFPRLYEMVREASAILDMPQPDMYVSQRPEVNAFTFGHTKPYVVLFSGMVDLMTDDELLAVIGHELGHIKCGHVLYYTMANSIRDFAAIIGQMTLGIGNLIGIGIEAALIQWRRRAELSADRAALLTVQRSAPVISLLTKLAGGTDRMATQLDPQEFLEQARQYERELEEDFSNQLYRVFADLYQGNHPFLVERVKELDTWAGSDEFLRIMNGDYEVRKPETPNASRTVKITVRSE
jgi:Zn-dependent protease with chaperone function